MIIRSLEDFLVNLNYFRSGFNLSCVVDVYYNSPFLKMFKMDLYPSYSQIRINMHSDDYGINYYTEFNNLYINYSSPYVAKIRIDNVNKA